MAIFCTGDTHIPYDITKLSTRNFPQQKELTRDDFVIICGDFGGFWDGSKENQYWLQWLEEKPFTTLFADGNHENFDLLHELPVVDLLGGKAHKGGEHIYHLMRGEVYEIDGRKFFTMGGASSHDQEYRIPGRSWWPEELPNDAEYAHAQANLEKHNWQVDYVITHCAPGYIQDRVCYHVTHGFGYLKDPLTGFLEEVATRCSFKKWFFGHYHTDWEVNDQFRAIYNDIVEI